MRALGNVLWHFPFLGFISAALTYLWGLILTATVVAAPIGLGLIEYGKFLFAPFGKEMIKKDDLQIEQNEKWKAYATVVSILYLPFGILLVILAAFQVFFVSLTIVGIPVAIVIAKSLSTYLNPVNKVCVRSEVAAELGRRAAENEIDHMASSTSTSSARIANQTSELPSKASTVAEPCEGNRKQGAMIENEDGSFTVGEKTFKEKKSTQDYLDYVERLRRG